MFARTFGSVQLCLAFCRLQPERRVFRSRCQQSQQSRLSFQSSISATTHQKGLSFRFIRELPNIGLDDDLDPPKLRPLNASTGPQTGPRISFAECFPNGTRRHSTNLRFADFPTDMPCLLPTVPSCSELESRHASRRNRSTSFPAGDNWFHKISTATTSGQNSQPFSHPYRWTR